VSDCHNRGNHAAWQGSTHETRNLSCTTCHSVHHPVAAERQLVKATEIALCATCHRQQVVKTERAVAHMPVREGKLSCFSCHNPHGSIANVKNLRVDVPRSARIVERSHAGRPDAHALSALPYRDAPSSNDLRQQRNPESQQIGCSDAPA
jgi:predicted CXXCH cytochrome family protein